jgi:hypothetical protein
MDESTLTSRNRRGQATFDRCALVDRGFCAAVGRFEDGIK